jgi:glycosyltransferase involved in cell wall biosynthesis
MGHKEIKIGLDGRGFSREMSGKETYAFSIFKNLLRLAPLNWNFYIYTRSSIPTEILDKRSKLVIIKKPPLLWFLTLKRELTREGINLFFSPESYFPAYFNIKNTITVVHDLIPFINPTWVPLKSLIIDRLVLKRAIKNSKRIITVSRNTLKDLSTLFPEAFSKAHLIYEGVSTAFKPQSKERVKIIKGKFGIKGDYILYVGALSRRKNVLTLLKAYSLLPQGLKDTYSLVYCGKGSLTNKLRNMARKKNLKVVFTGYVTPSDLPALYSGATVFVYVSFYEGFGLPVLEAMATGVPVVASKTSAVPETTNSAAILVNPRDPLEIKGAIERLLLSPGERERLSKMGIERAAKFTWERAARETIKVFEEVLSQESTSS